MNKLRKLTIIFILALITSFFLIENLGKKLNSSILNYVNEEATRLTKNIVNYSVNEILEENLTNDLFVVTKNKQNEIEMLDYNTKEVNRILKVLNQTIQKQLVSLEDGKVAGFVISDSLKKGEYRGIKNGIICEIPMGALKKNAFYSNFGPKVPIKISFLGAVSSNITTSVTEYGFNSIVLEVYVNIEIEARITMPSTSKTVKNKITAPLTLKIIQGIIPEYYYIKGIEKGSFETTTEIE